jgi:hypothetical protein
MKRDSTASTMHKWISVILVTACAAVIAQAEQRSDADKGPLRGETRNPPASNETIRFDDADKSGAPCAVPGPCGRCDCPAVQPPSVSPPNGNEGGNPGQQRGNR